MDTAYREDTWLASHRTVTQYIPNPLYLKGYIHISSPRLLILTFYEPKSKHVSQVNLHSHHSLVWLLCRVARHTSKMFTRHTYFFRILKLVLSTREVLTSKTRRTLKFARILGLDNIVFYVQSRIQQQR